MDARQRLKEARRVVVKVGTSTLAHETGMPVLVAEDPLSCVGEGTGKSLENIELLKRVVMTSKKLRQ